MTVVANTYPNIKLKPGDEVEWVWSGGCFWLMKKGETGPFDKKYMGTADCRPNGVTNSGEKVKLTGVVAVQHAYKYVLELR